MHIVLVTPDDPLQGAWGGITTYTCTQAAALRRAGHQVTLVTGRAEGAAAAAAPADLGLAGIRLDRVVPSIAAPRPARRQAVADAVAALAAADPSIVVEGPELDGLLLDVERRLPGVPVVVRLHGSRTQLLAAASSPWRRAARALLPATGARRLAREEREGIARAAAVVGPTRWTLETLRARGWTLPSRAVVIANPLAPGATAPSVASATPSARRRDAVLFFGRLDRLKGADRYAAIWRAIWARRPETTIAVLGGDGPHPDGGSWRARLEAELAGGDAARVEWLGRRAPHEIPALLDTFAVAAFCSPVETFGYTIAEAMRRGVACVVASGGGAPELGAHGTQLLLASRAPEDIADAACQLLEQPLTADLLGAAAADHAARTFDADAVAARAVALYEAVRDQARAAARPARSA